MTQEEHKTLKNDMLVRKITPTLGEGLWCIDGAEVVDRNGKDEKIFYMKLLKVSSSGYASFTLSKNRTNLSDFEILNIEDHPEYYL